MTKAEKLMEQYELKQGEISAKVASEQQRINEMEYSIFRLKEIVENKTEKERRELEKIEEELKKTVEESKETVKGRYLMCVYNRRPSIDMKKFKKFKEHYPEIAECEKITEYSYIRDKT